jgi:hypothetical protein
MALGVLPTDTEGTNISLHKAHVPMRTPEQHSSQ